MAEPMSDARLEQIRDWVRGAPRPGGEWRIIQELVTETHRQRAENDRLRAAVDERDAALEDCEDAVNARGQDTRIIRALRHIEIEPDPLDPHRLRVLHWGGESVAWIVWVPANNDAPDHWLLHEHPAVLGVPGQLTECLLAVAKDDADMAAGYARGEGGDDAARKAGLHPDCRCGADGVGWCDTHCPPVCVCAHPDVPADGVCRRCQRLHTPANPDLQPLAAEVREAWRTWLTDEGVLGHVEAARERALEATG